MAKSSKNYSVSLDALIPREAFDIQEQYEHNRGTSILTMGIRDLEKGSFLYPFLRKPDFQRETNEWDAAKSSETL